MKFKSAKEGLSYLFVYCYFILHKGIAVIAFVEVLLSVAFMLSFLYINSILQVATMFLMLGVVVIGWNNVCSDVRN